MGSTSSDVPHGSRRLPESRAGRWTLVLAGLALAGMVLLAVGLNVGFLEAAESLTADWLLLGWGVAMLAAGLASAVTGAVALAHHEHSRLVVPAMLLGLLVAAVTLSEAAQGL